MGFRSQRDRMYRVQRNVPVAPGSAGQTRLRRIARIEKILRGRAAKIGIGRLALRSPQLRPQAKRLAGGETQLRVGTGVVVVARIARVGARGEAIGPLVNEATARGEPGT